MLCRHLVSDNHKHSRNSHSLCSCMMPCVRPLQRGTLPVGSRRPPGLATSSVRVDGRALLCLACMHHDVSRTLCFACDDLAPLRVLVLAAVLPVVAVCCLCLTTLTGSAAARVWASGFAAASACACTALLCFFALLARGWPHHFALVCTFCAPATESRRHN